jgi:hypothetical protein
LCRIVHLHVFFNWLVGSAAVSMIRMHKVGFAILHSAL